MDQATLVDTIVRTPEYISAALATVGAVIGAVLATAVALLSVWMTNSHNRKQQAQQLEFESRERTRERQLNLRREVYLPAADVVTSVTSGLTRTFLADGAHDEDFNRSMREFGAVLTRVQMISTADTIRRAAEFQRAILRGFSEVLILRYPMMMRKADIDIAHNSRQAYHAERMKCVELMKEYRLAGARDQKRWKAIQDQAGYARERWAEAHGEWRRLVFQQEKDRLTLTRKLATLLTELGNLQAPLLAAIRGELEASDESMLIAEETAKTAAVGLKSVTDIIPLIESGLEGLGQEIEADERRRGSVPAQR